MNPVSALPVLSSTASPSQPLSPAALAALSDEEVAEALTTWAGRVTAGEARLMAYIGEFDERKAWAVQGGSVVRALAVVAAGDGSERCR